MGVLNTVIINKLCLFNTRSDRFPLKDTCTHQQKQLVADKESVNCIIDGRVVYIFK